MKLKTFHICVLLLLMLLGASATLAETYPKIDVSGYKKWEYSKPDVQPEANYFLGLTHLGGYYPGASGGPWQERLQLQIMALLTEKLAVSYDIEQQPEIPDKYDVKVSYDKKHELTFGDVNTTFSGNEFASSTKFLNGVVVTSKGDDYDLVLVPSSKLKSQIQSFTSQYGTNIKGPYSLGHGSIVEGSEKIEVNNIPQIRGTDYIIDYFEGKVTFNRILTDQDQFSYSYEYTNVIDLFFPALSKKDFMGFQGRMTFDPSTFRQEQPKPEPVIEQIEEVFPSQMITDDMLVYGLPEAPPEMSTAEAVSTGEAEVIDTPFIDEERMAEELKGRYRLDFVPIVPFSEIVTYRDRVLKKNEDYLIKYEEGSLTLLGRIIPTTNDPLKVSYNYKKSLLEAEVIPGDGSKGPYALSHSRVVPGSESISINERVVMRNLDYTMNYAEGKITFNYTVSNTSAISVKYRYQEVVIPPPPPPAKHPLKLTFGMTYMRESAQKGLGSATANNVESFSGTTISTGNNTIYLSSFPLLTSAEGGTVTLSMGGTALVEGVDYAIPYTEIDPITGYVRVVPGTKLAYINDRNDRSDGYYTGSIKMLRDVSATQEVSVVYTYKKSITGRYTGIGNGGRGPYYIKNFRNIVPGSEKVEVWETGSSDIRTYIRNSSFEANAGDEGYAINYDKDMPYVNFNKELGPEKNFSVYFQYIAPAAPEGGDVSQDIFGFDTDIKVGELVELSGVYARSSIDQVTISTGTSETFHFTTDTTKITLTQKPVIENSEKVFVNKNLINRDMDYFISYTDGLITFYYITLRTSDEVTVDYEYQSSGGTEKQTEKKVDSAFKYGIKTKPFDFLDLAYNYREIGFDFTPMGNTVLGNGSKDKDLSVGFHPNFHGLSTNFSYRETNNPKSKVKGSKYTNNYDRNYSFGFNPRGLLGIDFNYRNYESNDETNTVNSLQESYSLGLSPAAFKKGILTFNQKYDGKRSNTEDRIQVSKNKSDYLHYNLALGLTDRVQTSMDYQISEPTSIQTDAEGVERTTARSYTRDLGQDLSLDLSFPLLQRWTAYAKVLNHEAVTSLPTPEALSQTRNTTYHMDVQPISQITSSWDYNRSETPTVLVNGLNPLTERTAINARYTPFSFISTNYSYSEDYTVSDTAKESWGNGKTYSADWAMISLAIFKLNSKYTLYYRTATAPSGTTEVTTDTNTQTIDLSASFAPHPAIEIKPGYVIEDYRSLSTDQNIGLLHTGNRTAKCAVDWKPMEWFAFSGSYSEKITGRIDPAPAKDLRKADLGLKGTTRVFSWGDFVYDWKQENNGGEVLAGGTLSESQYIKDTTTYSMNFNVAQDNPILSSILFIASYKVVDYNNLKNTSENFKASLLTFEGTLNF
ncbi:MAG: hypothetical protein ABIJ26_06975 [Candidatus Margulisiibacteriota bacterium]